MFGEQARLLQLVSGHARSLFFVLWYKQVSTTELPQECHALFNITVFTKPWPNSCCVNQSEHAFFFNRIHGSIVDSPLISGSCWSFTSFSLNDCSKLPHVGYLRWTSHEQRCQFHRSSQQGGEAANKHFWLYCPGFTTCLNQTSLIQTNRCFPWYREHFKCSQMGQEEILGRGRDAMG